MREFPKNLRRQFGKQNRKQLIQTLTDIYREDTWLYPGLAELLRMLINTPYVRVGVVTRNITLEPEKTMRQLLRRHDVDFDALDFFKCIALRDDKLKEFRAAREKFGVNPALGFACGDEYRDFAAAVGAGLHPFIVSYGFEDYRRLRTDEVPAEVIALTPQALSERLCHALGLLAPAISSDQAVAG